MKNKVKRKRGGNTGIGRKLVKDKGRKERREKSK